MFGTASYTSKRSVAGAFSVNSQSELTRASLRAAFVSSPTLVWIDEKRATPRVTRAAAHG